jgi:thiol-disulfide isomerase/thioredoxin
VSTPWIVAFVALCAFVAVLAVIVVGSLRRIAVVLEQAESALRVREGRGPGGLEPGTQVPEFEGVLLDGARFTSASVAGAPSVIVFLGPNCPACHTLEADLAANDLPDVGARVVAVVSDLDYAERLGALENLEVVVQTDRSIADAFESKATPHAFAVDGDGVVRATATPNSVERLKELMITLVGGDRVVEMQVVHS